MEDHLRSDTSHVAEQVRITLMGAAMAAYEDASIRGLCAEGAWEVALAAMRDLDLSGFAAHKG